MKRSSFTRNIYKALSIEGSYRAARRGVLPLGRRIARQKANKYGNRALRRWIKP